MNARKLTPFLHRLKIRTKEQDIVPFVPNHGQAKIIERIIQLQDEGRPPWIIVLKSRQIGVSTLAGGLLTAHCVSSPNARAKIIAHQFEPAKELFGRAKLMRACLPVDLPAALQKEMIYPHAEGDSVLQAATAGSTAGGRGQTLSALHASEAAYYPLGGGSFTALLPSISHTKNSLVVIESTANGRIDEGEAFYQYWLSSIEERTEFAAIFLPYTDDPSCVRNPAEAEDAPIDEEEEELLKNGVTLAQIAWRRWAIETKCHGDVEEFHQEYPATWLESFRSTGSPAFSRIHMDVARKFVKPPILVSNVRMDSSGDIILDRDRRGVCFWEKPEPDHRYYIGADAARGDEFDTGARNSDFSAITGWNGTTGELAFRYDAKLSPEPLADLLNILGRYYNNALINVELTGNLGMWTQKRLRDHFQYPNLYLWKGSRDDAVVGRSRHSSLGWETTTRTRELMYTAFREALVAGRVFIKDEKLVAQMDHATRNEGFRWQVMKGHDDILVSAMLGWIAREQYPPAKIQSPKNLMPNDTRIDVRSKMKVMDDASLSLITHYKEVMRPKRKNPAMEPW